MPLTFSASRTDARLRGLTRPALMAAAALLLAQPGLGGGAAMAQGTPPAVARAAQGSLDKARAAQARGDLRTAQIEYRNAVRADPNSGLLRLLLAQVSLDLGDADTAEKEARAAIERNFDPAAATGILTRAYLGRGRARDLLRDFPLPTDPATPPALLAQIGVARVQASLANNDRAGAKTELEALQRVAPNAVETHLATATLAAIEGKRDEAIAAIERAYAVAPTNPDVLLRKAAIQVEQNKRAEAVATLGQLIEQHPNMAQARVLRAELYLRDNNPAKATEDVDAALRVAPGNVPGLYLKATLLARSQDWRGADDILNRLGPVLPNIPDGLLLQATVKRGLGQKEQALDAAQRYVARRPEDPRGAKMLAVMELEQRQPAAAAGTMERLVQRGNADAESYDLLGRALMGAGRPREAVPALQKVVEMVPNDAGALTRLAAAKLAAGDSAGTVEAAKAALRITPTLQTARELLIVAALGRGDIETAEAELKQVPAEARSNELIGVAEATLKIAKLDIDGGRAGFDDVLKRHPDSIGARLGLARIAARTGDAAKAQTYWTEVLQKQPTNIEALGALAAQAVGGGERAPTALAALEAAQVAAPTAPAPALTLANVLMRTGKAERALALLDSEGVRNSALQRGAALHLMRSDANTLLQRWPEAEAAARTAFADEPDNSITRRQLALSMMRNNDARGAEELLQLGLRRHPNDPILQQALVGVVRQSRGLEAALATADELAKQPEALPAAASLRGDLLLAARKQAEAAAAFSEAFEKTPSSVLAQRAALAWQAAGEVAKGRALLDSWLARTPNDLGALALLAQFDLQTGHPEDAERRLAKVVEQAPTDAMALNNLAWALAQRGGTDALTKARALAERAYFLFPSPEAADTLGWILVKSGEPKRGLPLLQEAVAARRVGGPGQGSAPEVDPGMVYRLAFALDASGDKAEALRTLEPVLASDAPFPERSDAEKLMTTLRSGR